MIMALVLAMPKDNVPFMIECNASKGTLGAILLQKQDNKWKPVTFLSKALNKMEQNYEIYDKELLTIMITFNEWWQFLIGTKEVDIGNHKNLIGDKQDGSQS